MSIWKDLGLPDMDHDGDVDGVDAMIYDDITSDNHHTKKDPYFLEDDEDDDEDYDNDSDNFDDDEDDDYDFDEYEDEEDDESSFSINISFGINEEPTRQDGLFKYYKYSWNYFAAIYDKFSELKDDYAGDEDIYLENFLNEIAEIDIDRAIKYWKWTMDNFNLETLKTMEKDIEYYFIPGSYICKELIEKYPKEISEVLKEEKYFNYIFIDTPWEKHGDYIADIIAYTYRYQSFELATKCYQAFLDNQKDCYTNRDLGKIWERFFVILKTLDYKKDILNYALNEASRIGNFGSLIKKAVSEVIKYQKDE